MQYSRHYDFLVGWFAGRAVPLNFRPDTPYQTNRLTDMSAGTDFGQINMVSSRFHGYIVNSRYWPEGRARKISKN